MTLFVAIRKAGNGCPLHIDSPTWLFSAAATHSSATTPGPRGAGKAVESLGGSRGHMLGEECRTAAKQTR